MPHGLDAWEPYYDRRPGPARMSSSSPACSTLVQAHLGDQVTQLRKPPWAPEEPGGIR